MICFPNAKINIGLNIINRRNDNFHNIETCIIGIEFFDVMEIKKSDSFLIEVNGNDTNISIEDNLIFKVWEKLNRRFNLPAFEIKLLKNIPVGAGLGGGSSDAAFFLKEMNTNFNLEMNDNIMEEFISDIGSDCPFFIKNRIALATSKGDVIKPIEAEIDIADKYVSLVIPNKRISTAEAYSKIQTVKPTAKLEDLLTLPITEWRNKVKNDFKNFAYSEIDELAEIENQLYEAGADYVSLSGSGSAIFSLSSKELNLNALEKLYFVRKTKLIF